MWGPVLTLFLLCVYRCVGFDSDEQKIMKELSWSTKRFFQNYTFGRGTKSNVRSFLRAHHIRLRRQAPSYPMDRPPMDPNAMDQHPPDMGPQEPHEFHDPDASPKTEAPDDEEVMKTKLFRLMYETVKDTDLKIKKAELVKANYENSTSFDLGYVIGDMTDKLNSMQDVAKTLKRLYKEWKPVDHVNAYEQIANLAIEVTHLADMIRVITATPSVAKK